MQLPSRFWADLGTRHFAQLAQSPLLEKTVAVLPLAATEQHGPHLPTSVDSTLVDGVIAAALPHLGARLPVLVLPTQTVGYSPEHLRFPGTLSLPAPALLSLWIALGESVARTGIRKLVLFNSHGGNVSLMDIVARELRTSQSMLVYSSSWYNLPMGEAVHSLFPAEEHRFGVHAGDKETSMMLALKPQHVDMAQARHFHSTSQDRAANNPVLGDGKSAKLGWQMQDYNAQGAAGNAAAATAAKGQALLDAAGLQLARLLAEVSALPTGTLNDTPDLG